jgi:hypothetical protein
VSTAGFLLAIAYLPGAMVFRLPVLDRSKRAALPAEERLFWAVVISVIISSTIAFALAGLGAYTLGRLVTLNVVLTIALAAASAGNLRLGPACRRTVAHALFALRLDICPCQPPGVLGG